MSLYTVSVTPDDPKAGPQTVVRVDTSSGTPRVTELLVSAVDGGGLPAQPLPLFDIVAVIAALAPVAMPGAARMIAATPTGSSGSTSRSGGRSAQSRARTEASTTSTGAARSTAGRATTGRPGRPPGRAVKASGSAKATKSAERSSEAGRVYRRMPDAAELIDAYQKASTVRELVDRYGVPRHTMNGWLARLRQQGLIERRQVR